jgi:hypothetical protein
MARGTYVQGDAVRALQMLIDFAAGKGDAFTLAKAGKDYVMAETLDVLRQLPVDKLGPFRRCVGRLLQFMAGGAATDSQAALYIAGIHIVPFKSKGKVGFLVGGHPLDVVSYQAATLVKEIGVDRLRICSAQDCESVFIKVGRREYCSERCQRRAFLSGYDPFRAKARRKDDSDGKPARTRRR